MPRAALLAAALLLAAAAPAARALAPGSVAAPLHAAPADKCETCVAVVGDAERWLADPATQDAAVAFVQRNLCALLPDDAAATCVSEARVVVAQAVASVLAELPPAAVCAQMGLCDGGAARPLAPALEGGERAGAALSGGVAFPHPECVVCSLVMKALAKRMQDPEARARIERASAAVCAALPEPARAARCLADVAALFAAADALLDDFDAGEACVATEFCPAPAPPAGALAQTARAAGSPAAAALRVARAALADAPPGHACDACQDVIAQAAAALADPEMQGQLIAYVEAGCAGVPEEYDAQCRATIESYGAAACAAASAALEPAAVCASLGYCDAPVAS
jgi:hypothetical protein